MKKLVLPLACIALASTACNNLEQVDQQLNMKLDPALTDANKNLIRADAHALENYHLNVTRGSYYDKAFSGTTGTEILQYMNDRVNYIVPQVDDLQSRLKLGWIQLPSGGDQGAPDPTNGDKRAVVMALNIGFALWMANEANPTPFDLHFEIGNTTVPLTSPRVGIVELGEGYTMDKTPGGTPITTIVRTTTLVHEARHSDCTGGMEASDLDLIKEGEMPQNHECGHLHIDCPEGHPLAGLPACDDLAWGAYSIEAIYAAAVAKTCQNCALEEQEQGMEVALDAISRVTVADDMLAGKLGDPDMSSTDQIRKNDPAVQQLLSAIQAESQSSTRKSGVIVVK
jgi:hypothetical protein